MRRLSASLWMLMICGSALSEESITSWIERMHQAAEQLSYRGTLVYAYEDRLDVVRVAHLHEGERSRERMYTLTGIRREVVREDDRVRCLYPEDHQLMLESKLAQGVFSSFTPEQWNKTRAYYEYWLTGSDRVAGYDTQIIDILPKDSHRYGYRLWLEKQTGLLLRSMMRDHEQRAMQQISFAELEITDDISDEELTSEQVAGQFVAMPFPATGNAQKPDSTPKWTPTKLPPGFVLMAHDRLGKDERGHGALEHMVYSDGLASVSVYVESVTGDDTGVPAETKRGGISVYSRRDGSVLITTIGELPYASLAAIGRSVQRTASGDVGESSVP